MRTLLPSLVVCGGLFGTGLSAAAPAPLPVRFGCQARTFGAGIYPSEAAFLGVVAQIGEVGFAGIETNAKNLERYYDRPAAFANILQQAHLTLIGAHLGVSPWSSAAQDRVLDEVGRAAPFVHAGGGQFLVCSASLPQGRSVPPDAWATLGGFLNRIGGVCQQHGVRCLYHNHWWECAGDGLVQLCRRTDPQRVGFAFDTGHALRAGNDPAALIDRLGARLAVVHLADASDQAPTVVKRPPLGAGRLNLPAVVAALRRVKFQQWIVLEEETTAATARPMAERGLATFRAAFSAPY